MGHLDCCICRYTNVHFGGICAGAIGNVYKLHSIIRVPILSTTMSTSYALTAAQCKELMENFVSPFSKASSAKRKTIIQQAVDAVSPSDTNATLRTKTENVSIYYFFLLCS